MDDFGDKLNAIPVSYTHLVLIHPESVVHSAVELVDGTVIAQLGVPDMALPIQYALTWPERCESAAERLDLTALSGLHFMKPELEKLPRCV